MIWFVWREADTLGCQGVWSSYEWHGNANESSLKEEKIQFKIRNSGIYANRTDDDVEDDGTDDGNDDDDNRDTFSFTIIKNID